MPVLLERLSSLHRPVKVKAASMLKHVASTAPVLISKASRCSATFQRKLAEALKEAQVDKLAEVRHVAKELLGQLNVPTETTQTQPEPDAFTLTRVLATRESKRPIAKRRTNSSGDDELQRLLNMCASSVKPN